MVEDEGLVDEAEEVVAGRRPVPFLTEAEAAACRRAHARGESGLRAASLEYAPAMHRLLTTAADGAFLLWKEDDRGAEAATQPENRFEEALLLPARTEGAAFISFRIGAHLHFQFPIDGGPAPAEGATMSAPWRRPSLPE